MLKAIQSKEDWVLWASSAALGERREEVNSEDGGQGDVAAARVRFEMREAEAGTLGGTGDPAETAGITVRLKNRADQVRALKRLGQAVPLARRGT